MIELSEKMVSALEQSKEKGVDKSLEDLKHIHELKRFSHFQWFLDSVSEEIRELESRMLSPRLVKDEAMPAERLKLLEWRKILDFIHKKEEEARGFLESVTKGNGAFL
jgi:hypothetical protein